MQIEALCAFSNPPGRLSESWNIDADRGSKFFELNHPPFTFWTWWLTRTKQNSPVFSYDLNSHTGTVSPLSNTFQLTHTHRCRLCCQPSSPGVLRPSFTHRSLPPLVQEEKKNLPHLLLKSQLCQSWDSFLTCRNISDTVWPKHKAVESEIFTANFFFFFFFKPTPLFSTDDMQLRWAKKSWQRCPSQPSAAQLGMLDTFDMD